VRLGCGDAALEQPPDRVLAADGDFARPLEQQPQRAAPTVGVPVGWHVYEVICDPERFPDQSRRRRYDVPGRVARRRIAQQREHGDRGRGQGALAAQRLPYLRRGRPADPPCLQARPLTAVHLVQHPREPFAVFGPTTEPLRADHDLDGQRDQEVNSRIAASRGSGGR